MSKITAIILAAGYSSRMGAFKPLLPLGEMSILEQEIRLFQSVGIQDIRVVAGYRASEILAMLQPIGISCIVNETYHQGMYSSVIAGIRTLTSEQRAFFILPADIPRVRAYTLTALLKAYQETKIQHPILYPKFQGMRGHPPLIASVYAPEMIGWNKPGGLRAFLEKYEDCTEDVEVADQGILFDIDSPEDYQQLLERWRCKDIPTVQECEALMKKYEMPEQTIRHCRKVAEVALCLGNELIRAGCPMNLKLIAAAALLHDIAKGCRNHAALGGQILNGMDYAACAEIVGAHVDMEIQDQERISEKEVVYLADKLVSGENRVSLETRFQAKLIRYSNDPQAKAAVEKRLSNAMKMKMRVESETGKSADTITLQRHLNLSHDQIR